MQAEERQAAAGPVLLPYLNFPHFLLCRWMWLLLFLVLLLHFLISSPFIEHTLEFEIIEFNLPITQIGKLRLRKS